MTAEIQKRVRKSPAEQIAEAKVALARAMQRQRASETRSKIVIGSLAQKWLAANPQASRAFCRYLCSIEIRDQDKDAIEQFVQELNLHAETQGSQPGE